MGRMRLETSMSGVVLAAIVASLWITPSALHAQERAADGGGLVGPDGGPEDPVAAKLVLALPV